MWPNPSGKGLYYNPQPDCRSNGPHRYGMLRFLPADKTVTIRTCRYCTHKIMTKFEIVNGEITERQLNVTSGTKTAPSPTEDHLLTMEKNKNIDDKPTDEATKKSQT